MNYEVIIPAAGQGKRMNAGKNKQFISLNNIPVIIHTLSVFEKHSSCTSIILVINELEREQMLQLIKEYKIHKVTKVVSGGCERQESVFNGLKVATEELVLVHDGARPFITVDKIEELVKLAVNDGAALLAVPVKDTIKRVSHHTVSETIDRTTIWAAQTPQAFKRSILVKAHQIAEDENFLGTDDASLVEAIGETVKIAVGDYRNIKLTTPEDVMIANALLDKERDNK